MEGAGERTGEKLSEGGGEAFRERRLIVCCVVPARLAARLHEPLRRFFARDPAVEVIVERRGQERRERPERRGAAAPSGAAGSGAGVPSGASVPSAAAPSAAASRSPERRRIPTTAGRRVAERRAVLVSTAAPPLPRRAQRYASQLLFLERLEPDGLAAEDEDSARLVTRFQSGDQRAFALLYDRYFARVYSYMRLLLEDPHGAEDATQQVFLQALDALPRYERRGSPFRAWLFIVARNQAISQRRALRRVTVEEPAALERRLEGNGEEAEGLDALGWVSDRELLMLVERLPHAQRQVLVMRYMLDLSTREIAATLNRSATDVRKLNERALGFLRQRLTALGRVPSSSAREPWRRRPTQLRTIRARRWALR
jgi:RNA polymerase sigma-70 factor (ECF subfamily)